MHKGITDLALFQCLQPSLLVKHALAMKGLTLIVNYGVTLLPAN